MRLWAGTPELKKKLRPIRCEDLILFRSATSPLAHDSAPLQRPKTLRPHAVDSPRRLPRSAKLRRSNLPKIHQDPPGTNRARRRAVHALCGTPPNRIRVRLLDSLRGEERLSRSLRSGFRALIAARAAPADAAAVARSDVSTGTITTGRNASARCGRSRVDGLHSDAQAANHRNISFVLRISPCARRMGTFSGTPTPNTESGWGGIRTPVTLR